MRITCQSCNDSLFTDTGDEHDYSTHAFFTCFKNWGGLKLASKDVFLVVKETEWKLYPCYRNLAYVNAR